MRIPAGKTLALLVTLVGGTALPPPDAAAGIVFGTIRYSNKLYNRTSGFTGGTEFLPVRQAEVEVVEGSTTLGSGVTDQNGAYSITIPDGGTKTIFVRIYARRQNAKIQAVVKNNSTASGAIYTAASTPVSVDTDGAQTISLDITGSTVAGAYNIFDTAVMMFQFLDATEPLTVAPPLVTLYWTSGSANGTYFDQTTNSIFLLGSSADTDEYDDDIITHELGHYVADEFSKDDSNGGPHTITGHFDLRLVWSEGWAHWFSSALRQWVNDNPAIAPRGTSGNRYPEFVWQVDTAGSGHTAFDLSAPSFSAQAIGADNELSVAAVLWDISVDTLALDNDEIWGVFNDRLRVSTSLITFEDFFDAWNAAGHPSLDAILTSRTIRYIADAFEPNNTSGTATSLDPLSPVGSAKTVGVNTFFPANDQDWFSFTAVSNATYKIETANLGDGADTTIEVFSPALVSLGFNDDRSSGDLSSLVQFKASQGGTHFIKLTAFTGVGQVAFYGSYDLKVTALTAGGSVAPSVSLDALPKSGDAPLTVDFFVGASDSDGTISRYEWDFEGDGLFDYSDPSGGTVRHTYAQAQAGGFTATVRVTDDSGTFTVATILITVSAPDGLTVTASPDSLAPGPAPAVVNFPGSATGASTPRTFEWDFEGDAVFDTLSTVDATASHTYTAAGTYNAVLRVTDDRGRVFAATPKTITVADPAAPPPAIGFTTVPSPAGGALPLSVTFTATAGFTLYAWDFEGDGRIDRSSPANAQTFLYTQVGAFAPEVRGTGATGLTTTSPAGSVTTTAPAPAGWIFSPRTGQTVTGNSVAVAAECIPAGVAKTIQFQFRQGAGPFQNLGAAQTGTGTRFTATWDTTGFANPTAGLSLRVTVNGTASAAADVTGLTVSTTSPQITEGVNGSGQRSASVTVDRNAASGVFLGNGTILSFPRGSLTAGADPTVQITVLGANTLPVNGTATDKIALDANHDFSFAAPAPAVSGRFRIRIAYPDANQDGVVDGTSLNERTLGIHWFDAAAGAWKQDLVSDVNADGNWVETETWHFTTFGVFGNAVAAAGGGGSGHGRCFAGAGGSGEMKGGMSGWLAAAAALILAAFRPLRGAGILPASTRLWIARRRKGRPGA